MKDKCPPVVPSPVTRSSDQCRVARWAKGWAEYFRNSVEEQNLVEIFSKDKMTREPPPQQREKASE